MASPSRRGCAAFLHHDVELSLLIASHLESRIEELAAMPVAFIHARPSPVTTRRDQLERQPDWSWSHFRLVNHSEMEAKPCPQEVRCWFRTSAIDHSAALGIRSTTYVPKMPSSVRIQPPMLRFWPPMRWPLAGLAWQLRIYVRRDHILSRKRWCA